jgi:hypothetical protein
MIPNFDEYKLASEIVEKVIREININDIENKLKELTMDIKSDRRPAFFNHVNSLFLNVLLNRLDEPGFGEEAKEKATKARKVLNTLK